MTHLRICTPQFKNPKVGIIIINFSFIQRRWKKKTTTNKNGWQNSDYD